LLFSILGAAKLGQRLNLLISASEELEMIRKKMYCLEYDKTGLTSFCFSGTEIITNEKLNLN
jgi:hypothetical protein